MKFKCKAIKSVFTFKDTRYDIGEFFETNDKEFIEFLKSNKNFTEIKDKKKK